MKMLSLSGLTDIFSEFLKRQCHEIKYFKTNFLHEILALKPMDAKKSCEGLE